jgi:hypothetical protein
MGYIIFSVSKGLLMRALRACSCTGHFLMLVLPVELPPLIACLLACPTCPLAPPHPHQAFVGRAWMLLRPWGLLMTLFRLAGACRGGALAHQRAVLVSSYRCGVCLCLARTLVTGCHACQSNHK